MQLKRSLWILVAWFLSLAAKGFTYELAPEDHFASISEGEYRALDEFQYAVAYFGTGEQILLLRIEARRQRSGCIETAKNITNCDGDVQLGDTETIYFVRSKILCYASDPDVCLTAMFQRTLELKNFKALMMLPSLSGSVDDYERVCVHCNSSHAYGFQFRNGTRKVIKFTAFGPVF